MNYDLTFNAMVIFGAILFLLIFIAFILPYTRPLKKQIAFCAKCGAILFGKIVDNATQLSCEKCRAAMQFLEIPEYLYANIVAFLRKIRWLFFPFFIVFPLAYLNIWVTLAYGVIYSIIFSIIVVKQYIVLKAEIRKWVKEKK